jgi:hypothetical protein
VNDFRNQKDDGGATIDVMGFSGESWTPKTDVEAFARILSEIVVGVSGEQGIHSPGIPSFVRKMIERGQSGDLKRVESFHEIFETLKRNAFKILEGVENEKVSSFVNWIESSEMLTE